MTENLSSEILANQIQDAAQENTIPDWLKQVMMAMAANAALLAPEQQKNENLPIYVYFH